MYVTAQTNVKKMAGFRSSVNTAGCPLDFPSPGLAPISGFEMRGRSTVPIWEGCVHPRGVGSGMENLSFKDIKVVVGDPNREVREGTAFICQPENFPRPVPVAEAQCLN